ncbi:MAG: alpha/beta hydrolase [Clostridia bacterium]|nr:alpha/beta hydrolase [Clostridia bacterium]
MSLSAKAAVSVMQLIKRLHLLPPVRDLDTEIARAKKYNQRACYVEPKDRKARYATETIGNYPVLVMTQPDASHQKALLFLHGGGNKDTWKPEVSIARDYGKRSAMDVFYPLYPPFTEASVTVTADFLYQVYEEVARRYGAENVAVIGGSYGGLLAMQLLTWINRDGQRLEMPGLLIMNSPFALPKTPAEWALAESLEQNDFLVPPGALRLMQEGILRADPHTPDYALYPDDMDFHRAPETYVFYGEESCACVADAISHSFARDGAPLHMHTEPGMMHCYACVPVFPESKRDYARQIALLRDLPPRT